MSLTAQMPGPVTAQTPEFVELWRQWKDHRCIESRNQLFLNHIHLARRVAAAMLKRYRNPLADWQDYVHFASLGLLQAIESYDLNRGSTFSFYAVHRIRGAVLNGLKSYTSDATLHREEVERLEQYAAELNREKDDPLNVVIDAMIGMAFGYFLEFGILDHDRRDERPHTQYEEHERRDRLFNYVEKLSERQRFVISARYFQHMDFNEIALLLDISSARVNQLHAQALKNLRDWYERDHVSEEHLT